MDCSKRHGTPVLYRDVVSSFEECINACAASLSCSSVDFDQRRGLCYLSINDGEPTLQASNFASAHSVGCSGACEGCGLGCSSGATGTPSQPPNPAQCTHDNAIVRAAGREFRVKCQYCHHGNNGINKPEAQTHEQCMQLCTADPQCVGANWLVQGPGSMGCYLMYAPIASLIPNEQCSAAFVPM